MNKYVIAAAILAAFAAGRFLTPVKVETKTVEVEKKQTETDKDKHKTTTTVTTEKPDGTKVTTTKTTEDTDTHKTSTDATRTDSVSEKKYGGDKTGIYGLAGLNLSTGLPTYGGLIKRQLIGPVSVGAWGLTNATFGVTLGLEF